MQITLNEAEIKKAIIAFVGNQGISITGPHVTVALIAGRAPNGMSAFINISNEAHAGKTILEVSNEMQQPSLSFGKTIPDDAPIFIETPAVDKPLFGKD